LLQPFGDRCAVPRQEGPDDTVGGLGRDPGHGPWAGAAQELDEDAFGHIVSVVPGGDGCETAGSGVLEQSPISPASPCGLAGCGPFVIIGQEDELERDFESRAQSTTEPGVGVRLVSAQAVMDVGGFESKIEPRVSQQMKQRDRVTTARERHQHRPCDKTRKGAFEVVDKFAGVHELHATSDAGRAGCLIATNGNKVRGQISIALRMPSQPI
jgi:hypothetical protein